MSQVTTDVGQLSVRETHDLFLFSDDTCRVGRLHWHVLRAAGELERKRCEPPNGAKLTEFGWEVGCDEINWWVFKREGDLQKLREQTEAALTHAQTLKRAADELPRHGYGSYVELLSGLRRLAEEHRRAIAEVENFVLWLHARHPLAPAILFTYRVWGSTRISDRWLDIIAESIGDDSSETMKRVTEIALGLWMNRMFAFDRAYAEVGCELHDMDPERSVRVPERRVVEYASAEVVTAVADYFRCIRDSLRNILLEIQKCTSERNLLGSDSFWRDFIVGAAASSKVESQLWDFKETLAMWRISESEEKRKACLKFAKLVAGFANAEGGVIVVGVTNDRRIVGLSDEGRIENDVKYTLEVIKRHVRSERNLVRCIQVEVPDCDGGMASCLVLVVAQAKDVVSVEDNGQYSYPVRVGSGLDWQSPEQIAANKVGVRADNRDFLTAELTRFVAETRPAGKVCE